MFATVNFYQALVSSSGIPIYLSEPLHCHLLVPPSPPPPLPTCPEEADKFAYSSLVWFHSAAAWKEQRGKRALWHDWLLCFFICKLELIEVFFSPPSFFRRQRLLTPRLPPTPTPPLPPLLLCACSSNEELWAHWYRNFKQLCFEIDLNRWWMSLCVFLIAFRPPLPLPLPISSLPSCTNLDLQQTSLF